MATSEEGQSSGARIHDFIFTRELAEVYLLLDHVSGRSDKTLAAAFDGKDEKAGADSIAKICNIGWPPPGSPPARGEMAATLLMAKDSLNKAAHPANGASIAFTLLVAGDDDVIADRRRHSQMRHRRLWGLLPATDPHRLPEPELPDDVNQWKNDVPSRGSLAHLAYPGLVSTANKINRRIKYLIVLLFIWLVITCVLSWNVAVGNTTVTRLNTLKLAQSTTYRKIMDIEGEEAKRVQPNGAKTQPINADAGSRPTLVNQFCRPRVTILDNAKSEPFYSATQYQICEEYETQRDGIAVAREDVADWLISWGWLKKLSTFLCKGPCLESSGKMPPPEVMNDSWASVLVEILASAVLPICYGFLGAGAAVVRGIYAKMRDSLLSPRDLTLAWGQLALGAVIGACIGLFVSPSSGSAGAGLFTGPSTLSLSALSFIAGFGVESVFIALESFIRRLFNITQNDQRTT